MANPFAKAANITNKINSDPIIVGQIRQTQMISTFGIGSIVDFIDKTVIIAGADDWEDREDLRIYNENLKILTGAEYFVSPKTETGEVFWKQSPDIPAFFFPEKIFCPDCGNIFDYKEISWHKPKCPKCFKGRIVASRFIVVCNNGHMEDFPYSWWVHSGKNCSNSTNPRIKMYNVANRSDIDSLFLECSECGAKRSMITAFSENALSGVNGYKCNGIHPHLQTKRLEDFVECTEVLKTRLRSSSSVYFPAIQTALSIPPWSQIAVQMILSDYNKIQFANDISEYIKVNLLPKAQKPIKLDDLIKAYHIVINNKSTGKIQNESDVCLEEYKALNKDKVEGDTEFSSFKTELPISFEKLFEKMIIVDKLTVIQSLIGFTRIKPWDGSKTKSNLVSLFSDKKKKWLPAIKLYGEGIFIKFNENALTTWKQKIGRKYYQMEKALNESFFSNDRFSPEYVLLHTFSHLFIRQLSTECGYSTASLKEKIYSTYNGNDNSDNKMSGVLIYLASSDSDGSLGGLISIAQNKELFKNIIVKMVQKASWCSADPFCINSTQQGFASLNYAACHDCCLLPETSCEFRNALLDRVSITGLPENRSLGYFHGLL
ncbi:DUF1998 domain-containing protein [Treponema primitia]|uniref:DrmB family protein n=1 Tax=Treponema primitia TaxID=88058 RepID=UPI00398098BE